MQRYLSSLPEDPVLCKVKLKMAADQGEFGQLLNTLLSPDNDVRTQAEVMFSFIIS